MSIQKKLAGWNNPNRVGKKRSITKQLVKPPDCRGEKGDMNPEGEWIEKSQKGNC